AASGRTQAQGAAAAKRLRGRDGYPGGGQLGFSGANGAFGGRERGLCGVQCSLGLLEFARCQRAGSRERSYAFAPASRKLAVAPGTLQNHPRLLQARGSGVPPGNGVCSGARIEKRRGGRPDARNFAVVRNDVARVKRNALQRTRNRRNQRVAIANAGSCFSGEGHGKRRSEERRVGKEWRWR